MDIWFPPLEFGQKIKFKPNSTFYEYYTLCEISLLIFTLYNVIRIKKEAARYIMSGSSLDLENHHNHLINDLYIPSLPVVGSIEGDLLKRH